MAESPRAALVCGIVLLSLWLRDIDIVDDEECDDEYCHTDEEQWSYITHTGLGGNGTYQYTCQQWGEGTGE